MDRLVKAGVPRQKAIQVVARAASRIIRPQRKDSAFPWTGLGATFELPNHVTLWAAGGGGSTVHSSFPAVAPSPPVSAFLDNLTAPGFSVPVTSTVNVSGGGAALQTAITAAGPGTRLLIQDSLNYSQITITGKTNLTIEADAGQTPSITAAAGSSNHVVTIGAGNSGIAIRGLPLIGNGNQNGLSQSDNGIVLGTPVTGMASIDRVIIENCTFSDLNPALGVPGVQFIGTDGTLHSNVQIIRCTFTDCSTPALATGAGYGAVTVGGFGGQVLVQNSKVIRVAIARAASNMRGVVCKNVTTIVEDVLCYDIGSAGSNESFKHNNEAIFGSVVGGTSTWSNCVAYNSRRGFRITQPAATMTVNHGTFFNDTAGIAAGQTIMQQTAGTLIVRSSVIEGAGDGTAFTATTTEDHNDIFNVAAPGKVLDATDLTVDPVLTNPAINDYRATAAGVTTGGVAGTPMGVFYPGGTAIFWAGVP